MSFNLYWYERLQEKSAFADFSIMEKGFDYIGDDNGNMRWPKEIARKAMYRDYTLWAEKRGVKADSERQFYVGIAPYIYLKDKKEINHRIWQSQHVRGTYVKTRVSRYFACLSSWESHCMAYLERTGVDCAA